MLIFDPVDDHDLREIYIYIHIYQIFFEINEKTIRIIFFTPNSPEWAPGLIRKHMNSQKNTSTKVWQNQGLLSGAPLRSLNKTNLKV